MSSIALILAVVAVVAIVYGVIKRSRGVVAQKGTSVGADLNTMDQAPKVRVTAVSVVGPGQVKIVLDPDGDGDLHLEIVVSLADDDFGMGVLQEWQADAAPVAVVQPPGSKLLRLRNTETLQHLTLRKLD